MSETTATGSDEPAIVMRSVSKRYGRTQAVADATLEVTRGELVVLTGPSGSGKSTILNLLAALEGPDSGDLSVGGHRLGRHARHLNRYRRVEVGIVFQLHNLVPGLTARQNVEVAMFGTHRRSSQRTERAAELLDQLHLTDRADETPPTMSGGERQRVALARALANDPPVILADEPTGSLDDASAEVAMSLFEELLARGRTILAVSHDPRFTARASRLIEVVAGRVVHP